MEYSVFIEKAKVKHGDRYEYVKFDNKRNDEKTFIICPEHGLFEQIIHNHLKGQGCPKCGRKKSADKKRKTVENFIEEATQIHNGKYDYSEVVYVNTDTDVCIICPKHGRFWQRPDHHLNGSGCPECKRERLSNFKQDTRESFIEKAMQVHSDKYDYSKAEYLDAHTDVILICPEHGEFNQTPTKHLCGQGCPKCGNRFGQTEEEICNYLKSVGIHNIERNVRLNNGKEIDIFIPNKMIGIEYDGLRWHSENFGKDKYYHLKKTEESIKESIRLIHIFEDEYLEHKELVYDKIKQLLGINKSRKTVGARECDVREVDNTSAKEFLDKFHIQGYSKSTIYYGAFYKGNIVGVMSFKRESKNSEKWELTRFATDYHYSCPGLGSKMFQHFIREYNPTEVKSFADRRWTLDKDNNLYIKMGFKLEKICKPDYRYAVGNKRIHKFNMRKNILHKKYGLPLSMTEKEMCNELGFYRIWDCGLFKYVWKKSIVPDIYNK